VTIFPHLSPHAMALKLREPGIQCNFGTYASHVKPIYGPSEPCPVSAEAFVTHLAIPMHANLTDEQVERVAATLHDVVAELS